MLSKQAWPQKLYSWYTTCENVSVTPLFFYFFMKSWSDFVLCLWECYRYPTFFFFTKSWSDFVWCLRECYRYPTFFSTWKAGAISCYALWECYRYPTFFFSRKLERFRVMPVRMLSLPHFFFLHEKMERFRAMPVRMLSLPHFCFFTKSLSDFVLSLTRSERGRIRPHICLPVNIYGETGQNQCKTYQHIEQAHIHPYPPSVLHMQDIRQVQVLYLHEVIAVATDLGRGSSDTWLQLKTGFLKAWFALVHLNRGSIPYALLKRNHETCDEVRNRC
jgi:hypothetical protein